MLMHHTRRRGRRIQRFLRHYIVGAELHFLFLPHWWCKSDLLRWDYRVCKEGPSEVLRQRIRSRWCLRCYTHLWRQHSVFLQRLSCRSGRSLPGCTHAGAGLHDEETGAPGHQFTFSTMNKKSSEACQVHPSLQQTTN